MLERIVDGLLDDHNSLTITLKSRAALSRRQTTAAEAYAKLPEPKEREINFPGATAQEAWNFSRYPSKCLFTNLHLFSCTSADT